SDTLFPYTTLFRSGAGQIVAGGAGGLGLELLQLLFQLAIALDQRGQLVQHVVTTALDQIRCFLELLLGAVQPGQRSRAGDRLYTAHAGGHAAFAGDLEQADVAGTGYVGAAAQLDGEAAAHGQHAHLVAVLLAEQGHGALGLGGLDVGLMDLDLGVLADLGVDQVLQRAQLLGLDRLGVAEVEAQTLAVDQRALLLYVLAQHLAQGGVQQVGGRMVQRGGLAHRGVDLGLDAGADAQAAPGDHAVVQEGTAGLGGVAHVEAHAGALEVAAVTDLATRLGVERGLVQHHHALLALGEAVDGGAGLEQGDDLAAAAGALVTEEDGVAVNLDQAV